jgi:hypothetical protein
MGKLVPDAELDAMLEVLEGDALHYCSAEPDTYTEASATFNLATAALTSGNFAYANGDASGRKATIDPPENVSITATGIATHVAITNGTALKRVTTCTSQSLTSGGTVTGSPFKHELGDVS